MALLQSCLNAVDKFVNILCEKFELEDIETIVDEFKQGFSEKPEFLTVKKPKKTKAKKGEASTSKEAKEPTFYRIFSDYEKKNNDSLGEKNIQKQIREIWENSKKGKYVYAKCLELKKKSRKLSNTDVFNVAIQDWIDRGEDEDEGEVVNDENDNEEEVDEDEDEEESDD